MIEEKKRKRDSEGGHGIKIGKISEGPSVVLGSFAGVKVSNDAKFRGYQNKSKELLLHGETEKMEYTGSAQDLNKFCIAVYDEKTRTVDLIAAPHVTVTSEVKARKAISGPAVRQTDAKNIVLRNQLGTAFGTKKAKKALSDLERNKIDADKLQDYESAIIDNIKVTTESLPTREKREEQLSGDRPIPPFDLDATDPKDSYPLGGIIPQHEWNAIRVGVIINETDDKKRKTMFPQQSSEYVFARVDAAISAQGGDAEDRVKMLYYASLLLSLYSNRRITNKQVLLEKLGNPPEILVNGLITRFAVSKAGQFGKTKDRSFVIDPARENKLLCYLLALALHIDGFAVDINPLGYELSLKPSKVGELFRALGCNVKPMSATEAESRGIPKSQAQSHKVAYLKAPLQLPEVVRRRRAGGR